jgi:hypothetical protein
MVRRLFYVRIKVLAVSRQQGLVCKGTLRVLQPAKLWNFAVVFMQNMHCLVCKGTCVFESTLYARHTVVCNVRETAELQLGSVYYSTSVFNAHPYFVHIIFNL